MSRLAALLLPALLAACAAPAPREPVYDIEAGRLPTPDVSLEIAGLRPCTDSPDHHLHLDANQPVNVMVHGCFGSAGEFRALAQVLAFHGQQSACFSYDDRAALTDSATALRRALDELGTRTHSPEITLIGHSQGALVARKAATALALPTPERQPPLRLVTVSGPFSGIDAARPCGHAWLRPLTLGLIPASCYLVTGAKWADITYSSRFILQPGALDARVAEHLKIDTDEHGTCRRFEGGRCVEDDDVFSLAEQHSAAVEADPRVTRIEVQAGHVEIVGDRRIAPHKLIEVLQARGVLWPTPVAREADFGRLLARVYGDEWAAQQWRPESRSQP